MTNLPPASLDDPAFAALFAAAFVAALFAQMHYVWHRHQASAAAALYALGCCLLIAAHFLPAEFLSPLPAAPLALVFFTAAAFRFAHCAIFSPVPPLALTHIGRWPAVLSAAVILAALAFAAPDGVRIISSLLLAFLLAAAGRAVLTPVRFLLLAYAPLPFAAALAVFAPAIMAPMLAAYLAATLLVLSLLVFVLALFYQEPARPLTDSAFNAAFNAAGLALWDCAPALNRIYAAPAAARMLGLADTALNGSQENFYHYIHPADRRSCAEKIAALAKKGRSAFQLEFRMLAPKTREEIWLELAGSVLTPPASMNPRLAGVLRNITARKQSEQRLIHNMIHDPLTGLPARPLLLDRISRAFKNARKNTRKTNPPVLILLDVSRFRAVNETLGRAAGDTLLAALAQRLEHHAAAANPARAGANTFALLVPRQNESNENQAADFVRKLLPKLQMPLEVQGREIHPAFCAAIAPFRERHQTAGQILEEAERALNEAKNAKDQPIAFAKADGHKLDERRRALENDLHLALEREEIQLFYQPIVRLADSRLAGFEALLRWEHPVYGQIPPDEFVPIAEDLNLSGYIAASALAAATKELARWQTVYRAEPPLFVNVNISRQELLHDDIVADVERAIARSHIPANSLKLEITETLLMRYPERAYKALRQLQAAGAGIAIDDFGSGYSNFSYLRHMPCNMIKIDRSLTRDIAHSKSAQAIVRAVVGMGHDLSMTVAGEGIDHHDKLMSLLSAGCDFGQGYYFARPMTAENARAFLPSVNAPRWKTSRPSHL